nr:60S ribosomal protein L37a-1 [Ipomoea batatas]
MRKKYPQAKSLAIAQAQVLRAYDEISTRYGASLRKQIKKMEVSQHSKYFCEFCGKDSDVILAMSAVCSEEKGRRNMGLQGLWQDKRGSLAASPLVVVVEVEGDERSKCLSKATFSFFLSVTWLISAAALDPPPPPLLSLYMLLSPLSRHNGKSEIKEKRGANLGNHNVGKKESSSKTTTTQEGSINSSVPLAQQSKRKRAKNPNKVTQQAVQEESRNDGDSRDVAAAVELHPCCCYVMKIGGKGAAMRTGEASAATAPTCRRRWGGNPPPLLLCFAKATALRSNG